VQVTLSLPVTDLATWDASPQEDKDALTDEIRSFFQEAQRELGYDDVQVNVRLYIKRNDGALVALERRRRVEQQIVVNTGECIVVVEILVPPSTTPEVVRQNLEESAIEIRTGEDSAVRNALAPQTAALGLGNVVVTSSTIQKRPLIASPPPPSPENFTPYTDFSLIFIVAGSVVGMFLLIVLARECDAERIRIGTDILSALYRRLTGGSAKEKKREEETVTVVVPRRARPA